MSAAPPSVRVERGPELPRLIETQADHALLCPPFETDRRAMLGVCPTELPTAEYGAPSNLPSSLEGTFSLRDSNALSLNWALPQRVGRFQPCAFLGGGAFGEVYRAYDPRLDREVALKVLRESNPAARVMERFFREARAAARLDHPNIVPLHDAGRDDDRCWIAYQFVPGQTLSRLISYRRFEVEESVRIVRALAGAIDHAHRCGVLHRDLKPANIILDEANNPRLTDFGLARRLDDESALTHEGMILGTPPYMSPEQSSGRSHETDARSDVYSLGVILYELLTGAKAPMPRGALVGRSSEANALPSPPIPSRPIPPGLDKICVKALALDPVDRYHDARSFADDLEHWGDDHRQQKCRRNMLLAFAAGVATVALLWVGSRIRLTPPDEAATPPVVTSHATAAPVAAPSLPQP